VQRRDFLATTSAVGIGLLAGCADESDQSGDGSDGGSDGSGSDGSGSDGSSSDGSDGDGSSGGGGNDATRTPTESDSTPTASATPTEGSQTATVPVGEVVDGEQMSMVVRGVTTQTQIGEFQEADSGNTFAIVQLVVKNTTSSEFIGFSGFLQTQLKDSENYTYSQSIVGTGQTFQGGQLAPGEVSRGELVYEVPQDAEGLTLQFDFQAFSFFDFERVTVDLSQQASSTADLSQNLNVDVHSTGDEVSYEDVSVAVNSVEFASSLGSFAQAEEGNEFAIVDITTTNDTDEEKTISTLLQMKMKDGTGSSYDLSLSALSSLSQPYNESQPLAAGESRRGKVPFEVPQGVSPLYWIFEFNIWVDGDKTFWKVR